MFDFQTKSRVPNYLGSRQQRRLLLMLAVVGVLAIGVLQLREPGGAKWAATAGPPVAAPSGAQSAHHPAQRDKAETTRAPDDQESSNAVADPRALFPGVREDYLQQVEDDTVFRHAESDAWFHLLALLEQTEQRDLQNASLGRIDYLQLDQQPRSYRGRLVTIDGTLRAAKRVPAPPNEYAIDDYYQLWIQPRRAAPEVVVVYARNLSEDFPLGDKLDVPCAATGFFFKRWAYPSQGGVATAPLLLARTADWEEPAAVANSAPRQTHFLWVLGGAVTLAGAIVLFVAARTRSWHARSAPADAAQLQVALESHEAERPAEGQATETSTRSTDTP